MIHRLVIIRRFFCENMKVKEASINKLVRDKIPEILKAEGVGAETYKVEDDQIFTEILLSKLEEEALEASEAEAKDDLLEELGDIETVIDHILEVNGWTREDLELQRIKKDQENGEFKKRIILKAVLKEDKDV